MAKEFCEKFVNDLEELVSKTKNVSIVALSLEILSDLVECGSADWSILLEMTKDMPHVVQNNSYLRLLGTCR